VGLAWQLRAAPLASLASLGWLRRGGWLGRRCHCARVVMLPLTGAHPHHSLGPAQDLMKTGSGRRLAQQRHDFMAGFLEQFEEEWQGRR
jgi:hypothetical protein